ncbi:MAG: tRNA pseudouridine(55) synthase TruB [Actinobacteria bacterium]|nr:tRNA pseudouridine(55) synthase TruB [Actinomycetota bacterium]
MTLDGLFVVDKPAGWTSHDVVAKLRGVLRQKRVGHAGTLDPVATGVLLVGFGRVTRLLRFLQETTKEYRGVVAFGVATDSLDAAGAVLERRPMPVTRAEVEAATRRFLGPLQQVPPMVSALKVGGRRLHELARAGKEVEREPRTVHVARFEVEKFEEGPYPRATVHVECSSGTYVRSLAADLGTALGGPAHLAELRRLRVGPFTLADAHPLAEIEVDPFPKVLSPAAAMRGLARLGVDADTARAVAHGAVFPESALAVAGVGPFALLDASGSLLAVYERRGAALRPAVVIVNGGDAGAQ